MKVIKVLNFKTSEFYFAVVDDQDNRVDPLEKFGATLATNTPTHRMSNCNRQILKTNLTKEAAAAEVIIQRKLNPGSILPKKESKPTTLNPIKLENTSDIIHENESKDVVVKDSKEDKLINTKKGTNHV